MNHSTASHRTQRFPHRLWLLWLAVTPAVWQMPRACGEPAFGWDNPVEFSYPYSDGVRNRTIHELRDPAVIKEGDTWYLTFTHFPFTHHTSADPAKPDLNSSPGIPLYSSKDLKIWKSEGWLVKSSELPDSCPYKHRFWAPEIHKIGNRFFLVFTADNWLTDAANNGGRIGSYVAFVGVADKVTGPYGHITWLKGAGCDTTLFEDDDGGTYAIMPFGDMFIQSVDLTGIDRGDIKLLGERRRIVTRDNADIGKTTSPDYLEGPWMFKRKGKYLLFTAAPYRRQGGDLAEGYWTGVALADSVWGPYQKQPQIFPGGHVSEFDGHGGVPWISYRGEAGGKARARLCFDPVSFNRNGALVPFAPSMGPTSRP